MPIFALQFKAELEGVASIETTGRYCLNLAKDGETKDGIYVDKAEEFEMADSRGTCHLQIKMPGQRSASTLMVLEAYPYTAEDSGTWKTVAKIEARGVDVDKWLPREDFLVKSEGGKPFESADLSEGDYTEYDDENDQSVSVLEIETKVIVDKSKK